jgi:hypothetical protein
MTFEHHDNWNPESEPDEQICPGCGDPVKMLPQHMRHCDEVESL